MAWIIVSKIKDDKENDKFQLIRSQLSSLCIFFTSWSI